MKTIALILSMVFSVSSFAGIREVMDDHRFFLTVEWDQRDKATLELAQKQFAEQLSTYSEAEMDQFLKENLSKEQYLLVKTRGPEEFLKVNAVNGASWNGVAKGLVYVSGAVFIVFVAYTWFIHNQLECDGFYDCHGGE